MLEQCNFSDLSIDARTWNAHLELGSSVVADENAASVTGIKTFEVDRGDRSRIQSLENVITSSCTLVHLSSKSSVLTSPTSQQNGSGSLHSVPTVRKLSTFISISQFPYICP